MAYEEMDIHLSDLEYGKYRVFAIGNDSIVSNSPLEFWVVPDPSPPEVIAMDTVHQGDALQVSCSRDGTLALLSCPFFGCSKLHSVNQILDPTSTFTLIDSIRVIGDQVVNFNTSNLTTGPYMIYAFDPYGLVSELFIIEVIEAPARVSDIRPPEIELFPNPVKKVVTLYTYRDGSYILTISSINGVPIYTTQLEGTTYQIDLSSFQNGVYFITIRSKDFVTTKKIVKL